MSDNSTLSEFGQGLISQNSQNVIVNRVTLSAAVLMFYDYFLTFPLEVSQIWKGNSTVIKLLFVSNRYSSLLATFLSAFALFYKPATDKECVALYYASEVFMLFSIIATTSIFTLRTFAIYERNWIIFSLLAFLGFIIAASLIWLTLTQTAYALPLQLQFGPNTCDYNNSSSFNACKSHFLSGVDSLTVIADLASLVNFAAIALFDMLVLILTVSRTARFVKQIREAGVTGSTIFVLFRDGIFYYVAIFLPTIANVVLNAAVFNNTSYNVYNGSVLLGYEINTLQILLVNRLVLNLSSTANAREELELRTRTGQEVPVFALGSVASVLETIGNPVRTLPDEMYDEMAGDGELVTPSDEEMRLRDANVLPRTSISGAVYQEG